MLTKGEFLNELRGLKDKNSLITLKWGPKFYIKDIFIYTYAVDLVITPHKVEAMNVREIACELLKYGNDNRKMHIRYSDYFVIGSVREIDKRLYLIYVC